MLQRANCSPQLRTIVIFALRFDIVPAACKQALRVLISERSVSVTH